MKDDTTFSTSGIKHYKVWTSNGANLASKQGSFGTFDQRHGICKYMGDTCLSGAITGQLYVWAGNSIKQAIDLHNKKPIDAIHVAANYVFTGGKDMAVNVLKTGTLQKLFTFTLTEQAPWGSVCGKVRAMCLNDAENTLFVGTLGAEVYQVPINMAAKNIGAPKMLVQGHYSPQLKDTNEVWGLAVLPASNQYVTVSDDSTLRVWDRATRKQVKWVNLLVDL